MRIILASRVAQQPIIERVHAQRPDIDLVVFPTLAEAMPAVHSADALVISDPRGAEGKELAHELARSDSMVKWVHFVTAGCEGLLAHPVPDHIILTNQGGAVAPTVAEHAMMLILALARQFSMIVRNHQAGIWDKHFNPKIFALEGRTLAIVGFGNIGRELAKRAKGFEMQVLGLSRSGRPDPLADEMHTMDRLHDVLGRADVVAVCVAASSTTRHLMDRSAFDACRHGALFINVSRGETVDGDALADALVAGRLQAAAIDVTDPEPLPEGHPLWTVPNLLISPHTAGAGGSFTGQRIAEVFIRNVGLMEAGQPLLSQVDVPGRTVL